MKAICNPSDALAYALDCTLATVDDMAMKKNPPKGEYARQKSIAQKLLDWCVKFNVDVTGTRAESILIDKITVDEYATEIKKQFEVASGITHHTN
jgi:hypothetical protein